MTTRPTGFQLIGSGPDAGKTTTGPEWYWAWDTKILYHLESGAYVVAIAGQPGPWHTVGGTGEPAFQNSWANYGSGYGPTRFRLEAGGTRVAFDLAISGGANGTVMFTLPVGFRPPYPRTVSCAIGSWLAGALVIGTDGTVTAQTYSGGWGASITAFCSTQGSFALT